MLHSLIPLYKTGDKRQHPWYMGLKNALLCCPLLRCLYHSLTHRGEQMFNGAVGERQKNKMKQRGEKLLESWSTGWLCGRQQKKVWVILHMWLVFQVRQQCADATSLHLREVLRDLNWGHLAVPPFPPFPTRQSHHFIFNPHPVPAYVKCHMDVIAGKRTLMHAEKRGCPTHTYTPSTHKQNSHLRICNQHCHACKRSCSRVYMLLLFLFFLGGKDIGEILSF